MSSDATNLMSVQECHDRLQKAWVALEQIDAYLNQDGYDIDPDEKQSEASQAVADVIEHYQQHEGADTDREYESLGDWWESEPRISLNRSDWSVVLETISESARMDECGDYVDQMAAREKHRIVSEVKNQADIEPPIELTRERYQDTDDQQQNVLLDGQKISNGKRRERSHTDTDREQELERMDRERREHNDRVHDRNECYNCGSEVPDQDFDGKFITAGGYLLGPFCSSECHWRWVFQ